MWKKRSRRDGLATVSKVSPGQLSQRRAAGPGLWGGAALATARPAAPPGAGCEGPAEAPEGPELGPPPASASLGLPPVVERLVPAWAVAPLPWVSSTGKLSPEADAKSPGAFWREKQGRGHGAGRRPLRKTPPLCASQCACAVGCVAAIRTPAGASMASDRKTKLSKNLLRMKVRGAGGARMGGQGHRGLLAWPRLGQRAYRGPRGSPALAFIHSLRACCVLGPGNWIRNPAGSLLKPAVE